MLGDERRFRRLFRTPIERFGDDARQEQLRRRVAPFLLRRTKEEVAAERQATDCAHRIGQDKPVFVYKLLTEGTVEQKVAELQARKQALADAMLAGGGAAAGGSLSAEDLELLFAPVTD